MTGWRADTEIAKWRRQISRLPQQVQDAASDANTKSQAEFAKRLRRATPLGADGGAHIRDTIQTVDGDASILEKIVRIGTSALAYAIPLEFGHRTKTGKLVRGTRFFRSVRTIMRKKHRNRVRAAIRKALKAAFPA